VHSIARANVRGEADDVIAEVKILAGCHGHAEMDPVR
jgi:hypothetical protein